MQASDRFQLLITHVTNLEEIEPAKRRHIQASLEYFKRQLLSDFDRRDSEQKILSAWHDFHRLIKGSKVFSQFEKDQSFWHKLESSVGVKRPSIEPIYSVSTPRQMTAEEFFISLSHSLSQLKESPDKRLLLFGCWYLAVEARIAKPFRNQSRIEEVYRYLHPRLKTIGLMEKYKDDRELFNLVKYFIKGSIC